jgi:hypothetical protein
MHCACERLDPVVHWALAARSGLGGQLLVIANWVRAGGLACEGCWDMMHGGRVIGGGNDIYAGTTSAFGKASRFKRPL